MSFRNTAITEYLYKADLEHELVRIKEVLDEYGSFEWSGASTFPKIYGYFHGTIKDLNSVETKNNMDKIITDINNRTGVRIKIVLECE